MPIEDLDASLLQATDTSTHCPFKGDASYWSLLVGERTVEDAVWTYREPLDTAPWLRGLASLYWSKADAWFIEDERVFGRLRDPYHRVDVFEASRPVRVRAGGTMIAQSDRAKLLFETGLAPRVYVPGADILPGVLTPASKRTVCPYKGEATYWNVNGIENGAWSYETPLPESMEIRGPRQLRRRGDRGRARRAGRPLQPRPRGYLASSQFVPTPASTASGGSSSAAPTISAVTISVARSASASRALEQQLVVDLEDHAGLEARRRAARRASAPSRP